METTKVTTFLTLFSPVKARVLTKSTKATTFLTLFSPVKARVLTKSTKVTTFLTLFSPVKARVLTKSTKVTTFLQPSPQKLRPFYNQVHKSYDLSTTKSTKVTTFNSITLLFSVFYRPLMYS